MRRAVLVGFLAVVLSAAGLSAPASAVPSQVTVTRTSGVPTSGVSLSLTVKVGNGLTGQRVWLEKKVGTKWKAVAKRKLPASKQVVLATGLRLGTQKYRVHVFKKGNRNQAFRAFTLAPKPKVTPAPYIGEAFAVGGRLPTNGVRTVKLQKKNGSSWGTIATKNANGAGAVVFARPGAPAKAIYRLFAPKKGTKKAFVSPPVAVTPAERTQLVSRAAAGGPGNEASEFASISGNGRFITFQSAANNLAPGDTYAGTDVYLRDRVARTTTLVSRGVGGPSDGDSVEPVISHDGRFVAFASESTKLIAGDLNGKKDIFRYDRVTRTTKLVSHAFGGVATNADSVRPEISADGTRVVFASAATTLTPDVDDNGASDIFLWNAGTDAHTRLSKPADNSTNKGGGQNPRISPDGKWVAFSSGSDDIAGASTATVSTFLRNVQAATTARVSTTTCTGGLTFPVGVSNGGGYVATSTTCQDLGPGEGNSSYDLFVRTMNGGAQVLVSHALDGDTGNASTSGHAQLSADGNRMVFASNAEDLVTNDGNGFKDIFTWTRSTGKITLVSPRRDGLSGSGANGDNTDAAFSANGKIVVWTSEATNVAVGDSTAGPDIVYRDLR